LLFDNLQSSKLNHPFTDAKVFSISKSHLLFYLVLLTTEFQFIQFKLGFMTMKILNLLNLKSVFSCLKFRT